MMRMVMVVLLILGVGVVAQAGQESSRTPATAKASATSLVNLNTANASQLEGLPGIGKSTAERILEYREKSGGFKKVEEILEIYRSCPYLLDALRFSPRTSVSQSR